jgi:hypothetical protein
MIGWAPVQTRISIMDSRPTKKIHPVATDCNRHLTVATANYPPPGMELENNF